LKNQIIHADVLDGLGQILDGVASLVFFSPPYNVCLSGYGNSDDNMPWMDYIAWLKKICIECSRILRKGGRLAINIDAITNRQEDKDEEYIRPITYYLCKVMKEIDMFFYTEIMWTKQNAVGKDTAWGSYCSCSTPVLRRNHEPILVWSKEQFTLPGDSEQSDMTKEEFCLYTLSNWIINPETRKLGGHAAPFPEELAKRMIKLFTYRGDLVVDPFSGCYDKDTEVLTKGGWKNFDDVNYKDEFLTRTLDGIMEYHKPIEIHNYPWIGEMISIKSRSTDLLVTPNHNMYVLTHQDFCAKKRPRFVRADQLKNVLYRIPAGGLFVPSSALLSKEMMYLIGLYVSEGFAQRERGKLSNNIIICQNKGHKWDIMWEKLRNLHPINRSDRKFRVKLLPDQMQFILKNCGQSKYNKFLSSKILSNDHLQDLYDAMILGDGTTSKTGHQRYYTCSPKLAGSFQELCLKLGYETSTSCRSRGGIIRGRRIYPTCPLHEIRVRKSKNKQIVTQYHISKVKYDGPVYCVTVPNHTLYVRRNGYTSWCGNSGTTCVVAERFDRKWIGIENDEKFCKFSRNRIESEKLNIKDDYIERSKRLSKGKKGKKKMVDMLG
tara:strand:- start:3614 stop:5428 length:1815 start_codon:yes stop_codon:yes gene_type:complete